MPPPWAARVTERTTGSVADAPGEPAFFPPELVGRRGRMYHGVSKNKLSAVALPPRKGQFPKFNLILRLEWSCPPWMTAQQFLDAARCKGAPAVRRFLLIRRGGICWPISRPLRDPPGNPVPIVSTMTACHFFARSPPPAYAFFETEPHSPPSIRQSRARPGPVSCERRMSGAQTGPQRAWVKTPRGP